MVQSIIRLTYLTAIPSARRASGWLLVAATTGLLISSRGLQFRSAEDDGAFFLEMVFATSAVLGWALTSISYDPMSLRGTTPISRPVRWVVSCLGFAITAGIASQISVLASLPFQSHAAVALLPWLIPLVFFAAGQQSAFVHLAGATLPRSARLPMTLVTLFAALDPSWLPDVVAHTVFPLSANAPLVDGSRWGSDVLRTCAAALSSMAMLLCLLMAVTTPRRARTPPS